MVSITATRRSYREAATTIRELRVAEGLSPEQLGRIANVSGRTIRYIENGERRPTVRTMFLLADYFGLSIGEIWDL